jgi:integrase/recombinase XerD
MILLSFKAGLRAKEIAELTWSMITDASGEIADAIALQNLASKGKNGGRTIPLHGELREALVALRTTRDDKARANHPVIYSERARGYSAAAVAVWFHTRFRELGVQGASSHSGRRTFITSLAKKIVEAGGSLRDVQMNLRHPPAPWSWSVSNVRREEFISRCELSHITSARSIRECSAWPIGLKQHRRLS